MISNPSSNSVHKFAQIDIVRTGTIWAMSRGEPGFGSLEQRQTIPQHVYINFPPNFASLVITAPNEFVDLPENPTANPDPEGISAELLNNGNWASDSSNRLNHHESQLRSSISKISWKGREYSFDEMRAHRSGLLEDVFISVLGSKENVEAMRNSLSTTFEKESFLYRAITQSELRALLDKGYKYVSHVDPSANFETQKMFDGPDSQVKQFAGQTNEGYSGHIIRWKIKDPLFYRMAGMQPPRAVPLFSHFLPEDIEISKSGTEFIPLTKLREML